MHMTSRQPSTCHPQRTVWAKRLCKPCYERARRTPDGQRRIRRKWLAKPENRRRKAEGDATYYKKKGKSPEKVERRRNATLLRKYGISLSQFNNLLAAQGGGCAICGKKSHGAGQALHVDHDHETGEVRGILCYRCNVGLSWVENATWWQKARFYIDRAIMQRGGKTWNPDNPPELGGKPQGAKR